MTTPTAPPKGATASIMSMRDSRPLLLLWAATIVGVVCWWWAIHHLGLWAELLKPLVVVMLAPAVWRTWRWLHARRGDERRDHDRRVEKRRD